MRHWSLLLEATRQTIVSLRLPELPDTNVLVLPTLVERKGEVSRADRPAIWVAPSGPERLDPAQGTNCRNDVVYPLGVVCLLDDTPDRFALVTQWRARLGQAFHLRPLPGTPCFRVTVEPRDLVDQAAWASRRLWLSQLQLLCLTREPRE
jgi:hypothetical protein